VFIEVDLAKAMQDGMDWYLSKNKVILTAGFDKTVPPKYFKKVVDKNGKDLLAGTN
jgi:2'-phosphotransferase